MKCKECGMKIEEGERYCGFCGQRIARKDVKEEIAEIELESGKDFDNMTPDEIFEVMMNQKRKERSREKKFKDKKDNSEKKRVRKIIWIIIPTIVLILYTVLELLVFKKFSLEIFAIAFFSILINFVLNYKLYF